MTSEQDSALVTDADLKAAANLNGYANWQVWETCQQHSEEWMQLCAHDFARHRIAAEQRARLEGAEAGLDAKSAELALMLISNAETWGHEYFRGFDDARQALNPAAVVQG